MCCMSIYCIQHIIILVLLYLIVYTSCICVYGMRSNISANTYAYYINTSPICMYIICMCLCIIGVCQKRLAGLKSDQEKLIKKVYVVRYTYSSVYCG